MMRILNTNKNSANKNIFSFFICCLLCSIMNVSAQNNNNSPSYAVQMANSEMTRNPQAYTIDWRTEPRWDYTHGLVLMSFAKLYQHQPKQRYFNYIKEYVDALVMEDGSIKTYVMSKYNLDMLNAGKLLFFMFDETKDRKYRLALDTLYAQFKLQPRTIDGGFWHKKRYTSQMWLDGLYMAAPFYAEYIRRFGTVDQYDDVIKQFELIEQHTYRSDTSLPVHGWDESKQQRWADKKTGQSPNHWSRSIGWYAMAMVDVLDQLPNDQPKKAWLSQRFNTLIDNMLKLRSDSGIWYQVTDKGELRGNYLESSGSAMLSYAIARAVNQGYLSDSYQVIAKNTFNAVVSNFIKREKDNTLSIQQVCEVAGLGANPYRDGSFAYYISENVRANDPKAVGPFILASLEMEK
nr:glycoside hydrolase family 88 protein [Pseudoalteromonas prydzensis]